MPFRASEKLEKMKRDVLKTLGRGETHKRLERSFHQHASGNYLSDAVFGANDGIITTFTVVAGVVGAELSVSVVIILGLVNLIGDGISMGFGNYLGIKSQRKFQIGQRQQEAWEIENVPEIEKEEVREILSHYGFKDEQLEKSVETITADKLRWLDFMMLNELGIDQGGEDTPAKHGYITFFSFVIAGAVPLIPFFLPLSKPAVYSMVASAATLFVVGSLRTKLIPEKWLQAGLEMLFIGSLAGGAAYLIGFVFRQAIGL